MPARNPFHRRFLPAEQDQARLPVAFITGFLGAGKTTLINALLQTPAMAGTAVAINEFGAVALDQHLIGRHADDVLVLANGCLCCNLAGDTEDAMLRLFTRSQSGDIPPFRRLLVEPSGLANPAPLAQAILRNPLMSRHMRLAGITTVIDALFGPRHLTDQPESRVQLAMADRIVLTKTDLASADDLIALHHQLETLAPLAPRHIAVHGQIDPHHLFAPHFLDPDLPSGPDLLPQRRHATQGHADAATALVLSHNRPLPWPQLEAWLHHLRLSQSDHLLRLKGLAAVEHAEGPLLIQAIHHVMHPPVALAAWPDPDHTTRLVLILRGTDPAPIHASWTALTQAP